MPTILYRTKPIVFLRTKKTGSHTVKWCMRKFAEDNQISFLEVRSKDTDTLKSHRYISHMPASILSTRLDVWKQAYKFTFIRNPWNVIYSYYYYIKFTLPQFNYKIPENYCVNNLYDFMSSMIDVHGTTNFNKEIYCIDNKVCCDVFDISEISQVMEKQFNIKNVPVQNSQTYTPNMLEFTDVLDKYIYNDYKWEIEKFGYQHPLDNS